ncbi:MAG: NUDIX domain-containing protein [Spirochaetales bacterium]|nr:NUDIX domain-containing protein [Spirochaetales bacterium]
MPLEFKRKFYFLRDPGKTSWKSLPELRLGWLQDTGNWETCLKNVQDEYFLNLSAGEGLARTSWSVPLSADSWQELWPSTEGCRLVSTLELLVQSGKNFQIEHYGEPHAGLTTVSVVFAHQQEARTWKVPRFFGPELTYDPRFQDKALAEIKTQVPLVPLGPHDTWAYGILPFFLENKVPQVVLVQTRNQERWIFPKGQPENGKSPAKVALQEGREEAGITGRILGHPIVLPYYRSAGTTNLLLYPVRVTRLADTWLEAAQRERRVVPLAEAIFQDELIRGGALCLQDLYAGS